MPTFHCWVRGVSKGSLVAMRRERATAVGLVPPPGFESCGFSTWGSRTSGGFTNAFCRKMPMSGWS